MSFTFINVTNSNTESRDKCIDQLKYTDCHYYCRISNEGPIACK